MATPVKAEAAAIEIVDALVSAWNAHDAGAFAAVFAADADFTNVFGMRAHGRAAIEAFHQPIFATMFKDSRLTAGPPRVRRVRSDVAAVDLPWEMTGARDPTGGEWQRRRGLINMLIVRGPDGWAIAVLHNTEFPAPELAAAQEKLQQGDE